MPPDLKVADAQRKRQNRRQDLYRIPFAVFSRSGVAMIMRLGIQAFITLHIPHIIGLVLFAFAARSLLDPLCRW